jgi:hypothetical protein
MFVPHSLRDDKWPANESKLYFAEWFLFLKLNYVLF